MVARVRNTHATRRVIVLKFDNLKNVSLDSLRVILIHTGISYAELTLTRRTTCCDGRAGLFPIPHPISLPILPSRALLETRVSDREVAIAWPRTTRN